MTPAYFAYEQDSGSLQMFLATSIIRLIDEHLGVRYKEELKQPGWILYTNPSDLFLNGVIDTRQGSCGNMALLVVAIAWRIGWPVHLATAGPHLLCRFDDGEAWFNIEATNLGAGGVSVPPNDFYFKGDHRCSPETVATGGDLQPLTPRQMLSIAVHHRARYFDNLRTAGGPVHLVKQAEEDYLRAVECHPEFWYHRERLEQLRFWGTTPRFVNEVQYQPTNAVPDMAVDVPVFLSPFMATE
jgi:hypothetical protein